MKGSSPGTPPAQTGSARRRKVTPTIIDPHIPPGTKQINVGPLLDTAKPGIDPDAPFTLSKAIGVTVTTVHDILPLLISWGVTVTLIFGGCCSNVFALETIVKEQPDGGNLITFVQFLITAIFALPEHFSARRPPFFLKPRAIPLARWLPNIILFFTVNLLNNYAFGFNISVPVHIILRSGGSVTSMLVGFIWGKRYTTVQVLSVAMLTVGIIIAAMADAQSKVSEALVQKSFIRILMLKEPQKGKSTSGPAEVDPSFISGLAILGFAQILSAIMGLYTQITYSTYGSHWQENIFYSHFLSLPLFLPFLPPLKLQFQGFISSPPVHLPPAYLQSYFTTTKSGSTEQTLRLPFPSLSIPKDILYLALNALTQFLCIRGVNLLSARTTALGVTIVLNIRKLMSLLLSIWLFGNELPPGVLLGAGVVFGSAGLWALEGQRIGGKGKEKGKEQ